MMHEMTGGGIWGNAHGMTGFITGLPNQIFLIVHVPGALAPSL
jgi:hypothetical protein